jgi:hypothetical protein
MDCIELVKEENGVVSIGGCKLGDKPSLFMDNMGDYCTGCKEIDIGLMGCIIDVDTMRIDNPLRNPDIIDVELYCHYINGSGIRDVSLYMRNYDVFPHDTWSKYKEFIETLSNSGRFKVDTPNVHSKADFEIICFENNYCEVEFTWSKEDSSKKFYIQVILTPPIRCERNGFDTDAAIAKRERRLSLELGKRVSDFSEYEKDKVITDVARDTLRYYDEVWGDRITKSVLEYRRENLLGPGQMREADWNQVYKNIGMSEKEVKQYREAHIPFEVALNDSCDMYRD